MDDLTRATQNSLDARLDASRAWLDEPEELGTAVDTLLFAMTHAPHPHRVSTRRRRALTGAVLGALLVGGGTVAAAASGLWSPWAEDPDLAYQFALPSGAMCEARYGLISTDPTVSPTDSSGLDSGLADWLASTDVLALADIDAAVAAFESGDVQLTLPPIDGDGLTEAQIQARETDLVYAAAVEYAVGKTINAEVTARGLPGLAYGTDTICDGVNP